MAMNTNAVSKPITKNDNAQVGDEAEVRGLISAQMDAICSKDLTRIMAPYAADCVTFDVKPPHQLNGAEALKRMWEICLPCFPDSFGAELRDLDVTVSGDMAYAHWLWRMTGAPADVPMPWLRITSVLQRRAGRWQIVHDHVSVPFNPMTGMAVLTDQQDSIQHLLEAEGDRGAR